jgi:hypothetical protein
MFYDLSNKTRMSHLRVMQLPPSLSYFYLPSAFSVDVHVSRRHTHRVLHDAQYRMLGCYFFQYFQSYLNKSVFLLLENVPKSLEFPNTGLGSCMCIVHMVTGLVCYIEISIIRGHRRIFQNIVPNIYFYLFRVLNTVLMDKVSEVSSVYVVSSFRKKVVRTKHKRKIWSSYVD